MEGESSEAVEGGVEIVMDLGSRYLYVVLASVAFRNEHNQLQILSH